MEHLLERNVTSTEPGVGEPIVKPLRVMVNADALMTAPEVVIMTAEADVSPQVTVKPATLLAPDARKGTTDDAKKLGG